MRFSPLLISNSIIHPLRYFFSNYATVDLKYNNDEKISLIDISVINDFHKSSLEQKPRILVSRGSFVITQTGLTDNLAAGKTLFQTKGIQDNTNMVFINGTATILIEARQEGTVELITDMVSHFLVWSKPFLCNTQGFKSFAIPMQISEPRVLQEDSEIFQVSISVPYTMEEQWNVKSDALKLNEFFTTFSQGIG